MARLAVTGPATALGAEAAALVDMGHVLEQEAVSEAPDLLLAVLDHPGASSHAAERAAAHGVPWAAVDRQESAETARGAYQHGAIAVIPGKDPAFPGAEAVHAALVQALSNTDSDPVHAGTGATGPTWARRAVGEELPAHAEEVLRLCAGVVATRALHENGDAVLLDLAGPGQWIIPHPVDDCHVVHTAHTEVRLERLSWSTVVRSASAVGELRDQLRWREAWAAAQARPHTEDRLTGLLRLLGQRFGHKDGGELVVDLELTHTQLAAATGRTRPTVTRALRRLCRSGALRVDAVPGSARPRYVLPCSEASSSHSWRH